MINDVRKAFQELLKIRGVLEGWRRSFPKDNDEAIVDKATARAVHDLVFGLSRATAHPPAWFRLAGRSADCEKYRQALRDAMAGKFIEEPPANTRFISPDGLPYFIALWQRLSRNDQRTIDAQMEVEIGSVASKRGRPRATEGTFIAAMCRRHFERITGRHAKVDTDPLTRRPYGSFYDLVHEVFAALALPDSAETRARAVATGKKTSEIIGAFSP